jgi:hypothetical protein
LQALASRAYEELDEGRVGESTRQLIAYFQIQEGLNEGGSGVVDRATANRLNEILASSEASARADERRAVRGSVRDTLGLGVGGVLVELVDRDVRRSEFLGEHCTDGLGGYELSYHSAHGDSGERGSLDLQVRVYAGKGREDLIGESEVRFNAGPDEVIDVTVELELPARTSEFEQHVATLEPLLRGQGAGGGGDLPIADLNEEDVNFLTAESGLDAATLGLLAEAHRIGFKFHEAWGDEACYAWFRKGVPPREGSIREEPPTTLRELLAAAVDEAIVPPGAGDAVEEILDRIGHKGRIQVQALIQQLKLPHEAAQEVVRRVDTLHGLDELTLTGLASEGVLEPDQLDRLGLAASLHRLTGADPVALGRITGRRFKSLGGQAPTASGDLARLPMSDWMDVLREAGEPENEARLRNRAERLMEAVAGVYPTVAALDRAARPMPELSQHLTTLRSGPKLLEPLWALPLTHPETEELADRLPRRQRAAFNAARAAGRGYPGIDLREVTLFGLEDAVARAAAALSAAIEENADLDLLSLDLTTDGNEIKTISMDSVDEDQRQGVVEHLRATQLVLSVADHPTPAERLLAAGHRTATSIALTTQAELAATTGLSAEQVAAIHRRANERATKATNLWMAISDARSMARYVNGLGSFGAGGDRADGTPSR